MDETKKYLTKEKYEELKKELDYLKKTKRKEIAEQLEYAKSLGDLTENSEYHEARENQGLVEDRINKLEFIVKNAEIVEKRKSDVVGVGSTVVVKKAGEKNDRTYEIVGSEESNMSEGKISYTSPLGAALMGRKKGDDFKFDTPGGKVEYKVVAVK